MLMEQQVSNLELLNEIKKLRLDVDMLKDRLVDPDTVLTEEEEKNLDRSLEEYARGETYSMADVEKARKDAGLGI